jgi:hypothetical protein
MLASLQAMSTIHGILPDGRVVTNVEVCHQHLWLTFFLIMKSALIGEPAVTGHTALLSYAFT